MNWIELTLQYASEIIAGLAIILAVAANFRTVKSEKLLKKTQRSLRRMDILTEIEKQNGVIGQLALITSQQILLLQDHPLEFEDSSSEIDRLKSNLQLLTEFKYKEKLQRKLAENTNGGNDIELHMQALTDIKRLRIRIESDLEKETIIYKELVEKINNA